MAMEGLLERHRRTTYGRLLDIHCPRKVRRLVRHVAYIHFRVTSRRYPEHSVGNATPLGKHRLMLYVLSTISDNAESGIPQVIRYARAVLKQVMPESFWGGKRNMRVVYDGKRLDALTFVP